MKRTYGNEKTNLTLSGKALDFYNMTDPITIIEEEQENGECLYQVLSGRDPLHDGMMTEAKLIKWLKDGYDEAVAVRIQFEAGDGIHFHGSVNYLASDDHSIYAEIPVPDGASEDYGYLTMKNAILQAVPAETAKNIVWWYNDASERNLADDASAGAEVFTDIR